MNWLFDLYETNYTAQAIAIVALVCMAGMVLGSVKVRGIGLGTAGVLFAGLLVGAVSKPIDHKTLEFVKELGLILFVFCIGLQLGPGFFASLRQMGLRLNVLAGTVVVLGAVVAVGLGWLLGIDPPRCSACSPPPRIRLRSARPSKPRPRSRYIRGACGASGLGVRRFLSGGDHRHHRDHRSSKKCCASTPGGGRGVRIRAKEGRRTTRTAYFAD